MRRLDGLSAFMIYSERPKCYQHTLKVAILDYEGRSRPSYSDLAREFAENIKRVPMLQWKLERVPLGINHPVWVQADDFDIFYHLRSIACPTPGDDRAFSRLVSELYAYPMDQSAPLWLTWVVDGLEGGRVAVVTLVHHVYTDGTGAARMLERLLLPELSGNYPVAELGRGGKAGKWRLFFGGLIDLPLLFARELPDVVQGFRALSKYNRARLASGEDMPPGPDDAPYSPFNTALSHRRTFVYKTFPLNEIRAVSKQLGFSINDVFIAACAGGIRHFLSDSDFDVDAGPLVCTLPVNFRPPPEEDDLVGNNVGTGYMWVPTHVSDAIQRLRASHESAQVMKSYLAATSEVNISRVMQLMPSLYARILGWLVERTRGKVHMAGNMILSNVVGPREHLKIGNAKVVNWISIGHLSGGVGLNITVWSYAGNFNICLMADSTVVPDGWELMNCIESALDEYRAMI